MSIRTIAKATLSLAIILGMFSCSNKENKTIGKIGLITVDPGHFHAALVQKTSYENVSDTVYVYAPAGDDLNQHLAKIKSFNSREINPTSWEEVIYTGDDFLSKMVEEKKGNVVVLAGNNRIKIGYIEAALYAGLNVLADKPVIVRPEDFTTLERCFKTASEKGLLLYDIMTERHEITTELQRELSMIPEIYGNQLPGTPEDPAITKESVHHFYKNVAGKALVRPAWFYNVDDQGEGIIDVTTHLVDLVQWECFPNIILDYNKDVKMNSARRWTTPVSLEQFTMSTGLNEFPEFLAKDIKGDSLYVYANGEINYALKGVNAKIIVTWNFQPPVGGGDTHYSIMKGDKANLIIRQGEEQDFKPELYIEPVSDCEKYQSDVNARFTELEKKFPGIGLEKIDSGWHITIPDTYRVGHEAHFGQVTRDYLKYLEEGRLPEWEVPNMIAKYYTTTSALKMARGE